MFCAHCGASVPEGATACPQCHAVVINNVAPEQEAPKAAETAQTEYTAPAAQAQDSKFRFFKAPGKSGKSFAALFSAFTLVPIIFIYAVDYIIDYKINSPFTGYIVGALLVIWICSVLPAANVTPAPVTAVICFASVALYIIYIVKRISGSMEWFTMFALPLLMLLALFLGLDSSLASRGVKGFFAGALISAEAAVFSIIFGVLWDNYHHHGVIQLRFSVICAAFFLMVTVIQLAVGYVNKLNEKK